MTGCCALGTCTDPSCYLCTVVAKLPQPRGPREQKAAFAEPGSGKRPCRDPMLIKRKRKAITR